MLLVALLACGGGSEVVVPAPAEPAPAAFDHAAAVASVAGPDRPGVLRWAVERAGAPHQSLAVSPGGAVAWATRDGRVRWWREGKLVHDVPGPAACHPLRSCPWLVVGFVDDETLAVARHGPAAPLPTIEQWTRDGAGDLRVSAAVPVAEAGRFADEPWHVALRPGQIRSRHTLLVDASGRGFALASPLPERRLDAWAVHDGRVAWTDWEGQAWVEGPFGSDAARTLLGPVPKGAEARVRQVAWSPDGARIVTVSDAGVLLRFDASTGERIDGGRWPLAPDRLALVDARLAIGISGTRVACLDLVERRAIASAELAPARPREVLLADGVAWVPTLGPDGLVTVDVAALCAEAPDAPPPGADLRSEP